MYCIKCGRKLNSGDIFCPGCGQKSDAVNDSKKVSDFHGESAMKKHNYPIVIVSVCICIVLFVIAYELFAYYKSKHANGSSAIESQLQDEEKGMSFDPDSETSNDGYGETEVFEYSDVNDAFLGIDESQTDDADEYMAPAKDIETNLWGFIDTKGNWVIEPQFSFALPFSKFGIARVDTNTGAGGERMTGFINSNGEWVIEPVLNFMDFGGYNLASDFSESGYLAVKDGIIDTSGNYVFQSDEYEYVEMGDNNICLIKIMTDDGYNYGYIDINGNLIYEAPAHHTGYPFSADGVAAVGQIQLGIIDEYGNFVTDKNFDFNFTSTVMYRNKFVNGLLFVNKRCYIDTSGNEVIYPEIYSDIAYAFSDDGLAAVYDRDSKLLGYINKTGAFEIEPRFKEATMFVNGYAFVQDADNELWGYIDTSGNYVVQPTYFYEGYRTNDNKRHYPEVYVFSDNDMAAVCFELDTETYGLSGKWGYVNSSGEVVIEPKFAEAMPFSRITE